MFFFKRLPTVSLFFLLTALLQAGENASFSVKVPPAATILKTVKQTHPRIIITDFSLNHVKSTIQQHDPARSWYKSLRKKAERILSQAPAHYEIPDGKRLLSVSRRVLDRVYTLALLYRLDGEKRFAERAWQELQAASKFKDWNPSHFLDTAELAHAFAIGYDWLFDVWSEKQKETIRNALVEKGLKPALASYEGKERYGWWVRCHHNWNQVCNGGIGAGALAIAEATPELSSKILHYALESFKRPVAQFAPDGAWAEGPGYWNYATSYHVLLLAALTSALGTDFGFHEAPGFSHTGFFPVDLTGPSWRTFNFADAGAGTVRSPQLFWLAKKFNQPLLAWFERNTARPTALDLVWFDPRGESPEKLDRPLGSYYRGPETATFRSAWGDPNALFVAFKAGDNRVNHSHLDIGTFILEALGKRWAIDLGADNYNMPGYFGGKRWTYYRLRAEGHNTLVINPGKAPSQDPRASTTITRFSDNPSWMFAIADITRAYKGKAKKVLRGVALADKRYVIVQDEITTEQPGEIWWFMHTREDAGLSEANPSTAVLADKTNRLTARILSPQKARFTIRKAAPLPSSPNPSMQRENRGIRKLACHLKTTGGNSTLRITVLLAPWKASGKEPEIKAPVRPLEKW